jgi:phenylacetate-CoA ligase
MLTPSLTTRYMELRQLALDQLAEFEALSAEKVRSWQLDRLNEELEFALASSPFYRTRWAPDYGGRPLADLAEWASYPFTTKQDLRDAYPFGLVAVPRTEIIRYGESTGTTGPPTSSVITYEDWIRGNVSVERAVGHYFGPGDAVFIAIPYELAFASYDLDRALESIGAAVVAVGTLTKVCPFERMVDMMWTVRPSGLVCTPTRALRLFDLLAESGRDPLAVGLKTFLYVGETCSPAKLAKIADLWNVTLTTAYGSTETNSLGLVCECGSLHLTEDRHYFEVVDPERGTPLPDGTSGELVLTSLVTRSMPLLRYRTGDLVTIGAADCGCGSPRRTLAHHGRVTEQLELDDQRINKLALEEVILSTPGTGLYYAAGAVGGRIEVRVECTGDAAAVCAEVADRVISEYTVPCRVAPVNRAVVMRAMDRMLKPGGLRLEDLS